jgi:hypothetical protein
MKNVGRVAASALCAACLSTLVPAQNHKPASKPVAAKPASVKKSAFVVARTDDKLEVLTTEQFAAMNKRFADDYAKAMQKFEQDSKAAKAAGKEFTEKPPVKQVAIEVGMQYPTREAAEAAVKKLHDDEAKKDDPKKPAAPGKDSGK